MLKEITQALQEKLSEEDWTEFCALLENARVRGFHEQQEGKIRKYDRLNRLAKPGGTVFAGSSLMEMFPLYELMQGQDCGVVYNRGVGGYTMADFIKHMPTLLFDLAPETIFLNIGSNDMSEADYTVEKLLHNYRVILSSIGEHLPAAQTYLMAFYPMNEHCGSRSTYGARNNARIAEANKALKRLSEKYDRVCFIDVNAGLSDETGALKAEWCIDGIHMYPEAYAVVFANLLPWLRGRA